MNAAGLGDASVEYLGAGALGAEFVTTARTDFIRVGIAVGLVNLVLLMVFLRAGALPRRVGKGARQRGPGAAE